MAGMSAVSYTHLVLVVLFLAFCFLFHADDQIVFFIDVNVEVFFCQDVYKRQ